MKITAISLIFYLANTHATHLHNVNKAQSKHTERCGKISPCNCDVQTGLLSSCFLSLNSPSLFGMLLHEYKNFCLLSFADILISKLEKHSAHRPTPSS